MWRFHWRHFPLQCLSVPWDVFLPQTLPITCSIRSAGLNSLCNRKNWRAYSTTPPLRMGAIFAQFYSWDRRRIHKLTFIFADNPSLWDFKVRGAIAFDVPSNLLFITFWYHFCNRTMGSGVDCISAGIHGDRHKPNLSFWEGESSHDKCIECTANF